MHCGIDDAVKGHSAVIRVYSHGINSLFIREPCLAGGYREDNGVAVLGESEVNIVTLLPCCIVPSGWRSVP